jgi:hypothetical protein
MVKHIVFRFMAGLVLLVAIAGIAFFAYQSGVAHGVASNIQVASPGTAVAPYTLYGMPFGYFGWFPWFGIFGLLIPIFLFFLAFGVMRMLVWGPRWDWRRMHHGAMENGPWGNDVPQMFKEWHRRMHAAPDSNNTTEENQK